MKKYLQACESGGSIYGKNRRTAGPDLSGDMGRRQGEQMTNYRAFYKSQLDALHKVFKRDK